MEPDTNSKSNNLPPTKATVTKPVQKQLIYAGFILLLVIVLGVLFWNKHNNKQTTKTTQGLENSQQTEDEQNDFKQEVIVQITAAGISPQVLRIPKDTRINWENKDDVAHTIAISPGTPLPPKFDNNHNVGAHGGYPYVIHKSTTFNYYLTDKPQFTASVIVN